MPGRTEYDVIVIGAGHNGLTAAALLAKAGRRVMVLEAGEAVGGMAQRREFHSLYYSAGVLHDTTSVRHELIRSLDLNRYGLQLDDQPPSVFTPETDGPGLLLHYDAGKASAEIRKYSEQDAERFHQYRAFIDRVKPVVNAFLDEPPQDVLTRPSRKDLFSSLRVAQRIRKVKRADFVELTRLVPMSVADWLDEWFETDILKAILAAPALRASWAGPRSPGTALNLLIWECRQGPSIKGGASFLATALEGAARANGAEILTGQRVTQIGPSGAGLTVATATGGYFSAPVVAASCDPKQLFGELIDSGLVAARTHRHVRNFRMRGTTAHVNIAIDARVELAGRPGETVEFVRTGVSLDELEKSFDAIKYGRVSERPLLDINIPTYSNAGFAPDGHTVFSAIVHYVPYQLNGGWDYRKRDEFGDYTMNELCRYAPGLRDNIVRVEVQTPLELENLYRVSGGHLYHGEHAIDQLVVRPIPECRGYSTPIDGLFVCGSSAFPGGGLTCAPGALAAKKILSGR